MLSSLHLKLGKAILANSFTDIDHDEEKFMAWVYTVIRNDAVNESRSKFRQFVDKSEEALGISEYVPGNRTYQPDIDIKDFHKELKEYLEEIFEDKPKHMRICFEEFFYNQTKYEEIVRIASIPLGTVKTDIHHIRKMLKKKFGEKYVLLINQR